MAPALLTSSWVITAAGPPLREGRVRVEGGSIVAVGTAGDPAVRGDARDLGPGILMPGLVNAHCHLELSHLAGRIDRSGGFVDWVERLLAARASEQPATVRAAAGEAIRSAQASGTVAVGDVSNRLAHLDLLEDSRLQAVVFHELIGWDPAAAESALAGAWPRSRGRVEVRLAAHAPHSVSPALFEALRRRGGPAAVHLAESEAESTFIARGDGAWRAFLERRGLGHVPFQPTGRTPVRYLEGLGILRAGLLAAHCVRVDADDRRLLAEAGVSVAVCPRSNRNLGVGLPPVESLLQAGVRVCLGTDSLASVDSLDLVDDMVALHRELPALEPRLIVEMATIRGAEALGLDRELGAIAPGRRAALAHASAADPPADPYAFLVSGQARLRPVEA
ncbi:MAG TPA: amidohydrolase family protein [Vicinamibacteria bacterium]|jgi:cytosine/adenosine deaminase-related metal-dependent hydrolase